MKKLLFIFICLIFINLTTYSEPRIVDSFYAGISAGQDIFYSYCSDKWSFVKPNQRKKCFVQFTKYLSDMQEGYAIFRDLNKIISIPSDSNYEFIYKNKLITYHYYELKFYQIIYSKQLKQFIEIPLSSNLKNEIFRGIKIIYISDFNKNREITLRKMPLIKKTYLLLNDTDNYFYKYSLKYENIDKFVKTMFIVKYPDIIEFSHDIEDQKEFPKYKIIIKNRIF